MTKVKNLIVLSLIINSLTFGAALAQGNDLQFLALDKPQDIMRADVKSERIPAGTAFQIRMETPLNSHNYNAGDTFRATLIEDVRIGNLVVLPAGTLLRGTADFVKSAGFFCRGGELSLKFDHAVTPFGKQIPLNAETTRARNLTTNGVFSSGTTYSAAAKKNFDKGAKILTTTTNYMTNVGESFWNGIPVAVTAPVGAFAGAFGGASYFLGTSTYHMFKKGEEIKINPGEILEITLVEPMDVPTN